MSLFSALRRRLAAELDPRIAPSFHGLFEAEPVTVYDIGAAGGLFTPFPDGPTNWAPVIGFEPHAESFQKLSGETHTEHTAIHQIALCDQDDEVSFHAGVGTARTLSSLLDIECLGVKSNVERIKGLKMDSVPERLSITPANFIKLDTEGSEAIILENGSEMLRNHVLGVMSEVAFWRDTEGCEFSDIDKLLTSHGFVLFDLQINRSDLRAVGGRKDKVRSGDALYLRNFDTLPPAPDDSNRRRAQLLKLMSLAIAFRYLNYALELADYGRRQSLLSDEEFADAIEPILATVDLSDRIPTFPGRMALARLFDVLSYAFHPSMKKGIPHAFNGIGNHWVVRRKGRPPARIEIYCPVLSDGALHRRKQIEIRPGRESVAQ